MRGESFFETVKTNPYKVLTILIISLTLILGIALADFYPYGNIIMNDQNITGGDVINFTLYYGNGSQLTGVISSANSSEYWDNLNTFNSTQMENSGGELNILVSWLEGLFILDTEEGDLNVNQSDWWDNMNSYTDIPHATPSNGDITHFSLADEIYDWVMAFNYYNSSDFSIGDYSTTTEIIAFGYYNASDFVITDYFTKTQIENFNYYNSTDFSISDYYTKAQVLAFNYYNSSDFDINDYVTSITLAGYNYYNFSDFNINDYATDAKVDSIGNFSAWDKDYVDLTNKPTNLTEFTDDLGDRGYDSLSNFSDDLGNRGYSHLSNFTDNIGVSSDWDEIGDVPVANITDGDNTHLALVDDIYDWVIGLAYTTLSHLQTNYYNKTETYTQAEVLALNSSWDYTTDTNCNTSGSCSSGDVAYMDYSNSGNFTIDDWFNGKYNWTTTDEWSSFDGSTFDFNESNLATTYFLANATNVITGTGSGTLANIQTYDGITYNVTEVASDFELIVNFTGITEFTTLLVRHKTDVEAGHLATIQIWDYNDSSWEGFGYLSEETTSRMQTFGVYNDDDLISGGIVQVRFYQVETGNFAHVHQFDWVGLSKGYGTPVGEEIDPLSIYKDGSMSLDGNWDAGDYNITAQEFLADSWSNVSITESQVSDADWWDADGDINADEISESKINFVTSCSAGEYYRLTGNDLECTTPTDTTYTAGNKLYLTSTEFNVNDTEINTSIEAYGYSTEVGTVTSVATDDTYLTGGAITTTGTVTFNTTLAGTSLAVNSSDNWDNLGSPSDINAADITDDGTYRLDSWDNFTGIPHATPSNSDVTHFSLADEIFDYIVSLAYATISYVDSLGNWSADKSSYWNTSLDLDTVIATNEITELKIDFNTVCAAGNHLYVNGNNLACEADDDTTYTALAPLGLSGTEFNLTTCADNEILKMNSTGDWNCEADAGGSGVNMWVDNGTFLRPNTSYADNIGVGNSEGDSYIYFYEGGSAIGRYLKWDNGNNQFVFNDGIYAAVSTIGFKTDGDILTTASGDDLWLGNLVQGSASFRAYANGNLYMGGDLTGADDINATEFYQNGNKTLDVATTFAGDVEGTYDAITLDCSDVAGAGLDCSGEDLIHNDTSSQASIDNSALTFIQDLVLDTYGHITGQTSSVIPTATPSDGDTTHLSTADQIYDYIVSLAYSSFGASVDDTEMTAEDFGEFTCNGSEDGCTLDSGTFDDEYIELEDNLVGDVTGPYGATIVGDDSHNHSYITITPMTEANLYTILSDVTQFYESGDKVGDADTLDTHDTSYFQIDLTDEASLYTSLSDVTEFIETNDSASLNSLQITSALTVANGGTGTQSFTDGSILFGAATGALEPSAQFPAGATIIGITEGTNPALVVAFTAHDGFLKHEFGGLEANVAGYTNGLYGVIGGSTADIDNSSEMASVIDDETGTGLMVFSNSPTLVTPTLGAASATTLDTGQGAYELYAMNQDVESTDDVTFQNVTTHNLNSINCIYFDSGGKICSP